MNTPSPLTRITGWLIVAAALGLLIEFSGITNYFLSLPSLIIVLGLMFGGLLASYGYRTTVRSIRRAITSPGTMGRKENEQARRVLQAATQLAWAAGGVAFLVGACAMLVNMSDPSSIGSGLAITLLCPLYAAIVGDVICGTLRHRLEAQTREP